MGRAGSSVALVHDYLLVMRGAERTFLEMASCWPDAPIFTLLYDATATQHAFSGRDVTTSYLQRLPIRQSGFRRLLPLFPSAAGRLPLEGYELVVSSSSAFAHGVRASRGAIQVCYCHTPFRYAWHERKQALAEVPRWLRRPANRVLERVRSWDQAASARVSHYVANSEVVERRIGDCYGRDATVIHPPVDVERFRPGEPADFLLVVGEAVPHKRFDLALEAARRAGKRIRVVGEGPALKQLKDAYSSSAEFLGRVSDGELAELYASCLALVVPGVEEFGIAAVEAQASGRPVIAARAGGATETVVDGRTGVLVEPENVEALAFALEHTDYGSFSADVLREHAKRFSREAFRRRMVEVVGRLSQTTRGQLHTNNKLGARAVGGEVDVRAARIERPPKLFDRVR